MANDRTHQDAMPAPVEGEDGGVGQAAAVVRVICVEGSHSRSILGYGFDSEEAYGNAIAEATEFCRAFGGIKTLTKL